MNLMKTFSELQIKTQSEIFYQSYQQMKSGSSASFQRYLASLDTNDLIRRGLIVPELATTMVTYIYDDLFLKKANNSCGIDIQKLAQLKPGFSHRHSFYEILYVLYGTLEHTLGNQMHTFREGDIIALSPGSEHTVFIPDKSIVIALRCKSTLARSLFTNPLFCSQNYISSFFASASLQPAKENCLTFHTGNDEYLKNLVLEMYEMNQNQADLTIQHCLFMLFWSKVSFYYSASHEHSSFVSSNDILALSVLSYIQNNPETASLSHLALKLNYTVEHTSKLVIRLTGQPFSKLLIQSKLSKAVDLLKRTNLPIAEIAALCGYQNPESFIRFFRKGLSMTPSVFRQQTSG